MIEFKNLHDLLSKLPDELSCRQYFEQYRWEDGRPVCPYCGSGKAYRIEKGKRFKCGNSECYKKYSVLVGTIFEASNLPLQKWFIALYMVTAHKKGISSCQLARDLGITQKSAWFMLMRIRELGRAKKPLVLENEVQADEMYVGGLEKNKHKDKRTIVNDHAGSSAGKTIVAGMIETGGRVVANVIPVVTKATIWEQISTHVDRKAKLITDSHSAYIKIGKKYEHIQIKGDDGKYKIGRFHTGGIENFWSLLSRMCIGIYRTVSPKHLQRYCDELSFRFNSRKIKDGQRFLLALKSSQGSLTYRNLIANSLTSWEHGKEIDQITED